MSAASHNPSRAVGSTSSLLPVTWKGECVCTSRVHQLFRRGARFFHRCLLCGAVRPSDHCANMAGEVEVTPAAICCGRRRHWADSAACFGDVLVQVVGVGERGEDFTVSFRQACGQVLQLLMTFSSIKFMNESLKVSKKEK